MKKKILGIAAVFVFVGCTPAQYKIDKSIESNRNIQVVVNDFMDFLHKKYKRGQWIKIEGGDGNPYISKLRQTAIKKGLKVCVHTCPKNAITFNTQIEKIDGTLLEATMTTPRYSFHRIYKLDKNNRIKRFGNSTIYSR